MLHCHSDHNAQLRRHDPLARCGADHSRGTAENQEMATGVVDKRCWVTTRSGRFHGVDTQRQSVPFTELSLCQIEVVAHRIFRTGDVIWSPHLLTRHDSRNRNLRISSTRLTIITCLSEHQVCVTSRILESRGQKLRTSEVPRGQGRTRLAIAQFRARSPPRRADFVSPSYIPHSTWR